MRRWLLILVGLAALCGGNAWAFGPDEPMADPVLETRARALSKELRCVVCQNQSIDESDADLAKAMRDLVRARLLAGDSDSDVLGALQARYGDFIRLKPPFKATTALLWLAPALFLGVGLSLWWRTLRRGTAPLATIDEASETVGDPLPRPGARALFVAATAAVLASAALYAVVGHPRLPDQPFRPRLAERLGTSVAAVTEMEAMAKKLEDRLTAVPDDGRAWAMLGRADRYLDRQAEAVAALRRAVALGETDAATVGDLAESIAVRDNRMTEEARMLFERVRLSRPDDPRAGFFLGFAAMEDGDAARAAEIWRETAARQPQGSPWQRRLEAQAAQFGAALSPRPAP